MNEREPYHQVTEKLYRIMMDKFTNREPPKNIWFTDTVFCGRKKIFRILTGDEYLNTRDLNNIWLGIIVGDALKELGIASEVPVEYRSMHGRIDILLDTGEPLEIKTASNLYIPASEYAKVHVEQLSRYCLALGRESGVIFYYIPRLSLDKLPAYRYRFNLDEVRRETDYRLDIMERAFKTLDPFTIPPTWHSTSPDNWECKKCVFSRVCWK